MDPLRHLPPPEDHELCAGHWATPAFTAIPVGRHQEARPRRAGDGRRTRKGASAITLFHDVPWDRTAVSALRLIAVEGDSGHHYVVAEDPRAAGPQALGPAPGAVAKGWLGSTWAADLALDSFCRPVPLDRAATTTALRIDERAHATGRDDMTTIRTVRPSVAVSAVDVVWQGRDSWRIDVLLAGTARAYVHDGRRWARIAPPSTSVNNKVEPRRSAPPGRPALHIAPRPAATVAGVGSLPPSEPLELRTASIAGGGDLAEWSVLVTTLGLPIDRLGTSASAPAIDAPNARGGPLDGTRDHPAATAGLGPACVLLPHDVELPAIGSSIGRADGGFEVVRPSVVLVPNTAAAPISPRPPARLRPRPPARLRPTSTTNSLWT